MELLSGPWPTRSAWAALPIAVGPALGDALDGSTRSVAVTGAVLAWGAWAAVLADLESDGVDAPVVPLGRSGQTRQLRSVLDDPRPGRSVTPVASDAWLCD